MSDTEEDPTPPAYAERDGSEKSAPTGGGVQPPPGEGGEGANEEREEVE
jgi:hypothetical protein